MKKLVLQNLDNMYVHVSYELDTTADVIVKTAKDKYNRFDLKDLELKGDEPIITIKFSNNRDDESFDGNNWKMVYTD